MSPESYSGDLMILQIYGQFFRKCNHIISYVILTKIEALLQHHKLSSFHFAFIYIFYRKEINALRDGVF